jgi:hypothetical protein
VLSGGTGDVGRAKRTLERLDLVGTTEEYDSFLSVLALKMGWNVEDLVYQKAKVARYEDFSPTNEEAQLLKHELRHEIELYEFSKTLFASRLRTFPAFPETLGRFRKAQSLVVQNCK